MYNIKRMITYLQNKPIIGIIGGFSGTFFATIKDFLIDDTTVKMVSIMGVYIGFFIAILTGIIKIIQVLRLAKEKK